MDYLQMARGIGTFVTHTFSHPHFPPCAVILSSSYNSLFPTHTPNLSLPISMDLINQPSSSFSLLSSVHPPLTASFRIIHCKLNNISETKTNPKHQSVPLLVCGKRLHSSHHHHHLFISTSQNTFNLAFLHKPQHIITLLVSS